RSVAITREWTTSCSWRSRSAAPPRRSTASPTCSPRLPDEAHLREVASGPPGLGAAALREAAAGGGSGRPAPGRAPSPAGGPGVRARPPFHRALDAELRSGHGLLPARLLHDEVQ